jgi:hypothetical protein
MFAAYLTGSTAMAVKRRASARLPGLRRNESL